MSCRCFFPNVFNINRAHRQAIIQQQQQQQHQQLLAAAPTAVQGPQVAGVLPQPALPQAQPQQLGHVQPAAVSRLPQVQSTAVPTIQQPNNPFLQASLYHAMKQHTGESPVTMDDLGNMMLTQGTSRVCYRGANASDKFQKHLSRC